MSHIDDLTHRRAAKIVLNKRVPASTCIICITIVPGPLFLFLHIVLFPSLSHCSGTQHCDPAVFFGSLRRIQSSAKKVHIPVRFFNHYAQHVRCLGAISCANVSLRHPSNGWICSEMRGAFSPPPTTPPTSTRFFHQSKLFYGFA